MTGVATASLISIAFMIIVLILLGRISYYLKHILKEMRNVPIREKGDDLKYSNKINQEY